MRFAAVVSLCLVLTGCGSYAPQSSKTSAPSAGKAAPAPGLASILYTIADNITGTAPCGTSAVSQMIGYVLTYTFPFTGPGTDPFYILRFAAGATGNAVPTAALLSVSGAGISAH